jgi:hypothetical protein
MNYSTAAVALALVACTASCAGNNPANTRDGSSGYRSVATEMELSKVPLDPNRRISVQDCTQGYIPDGGNLRCR